MTSPRHAPPAPLPPVAPASPPAPVADATGAALRATAPLLAYPYRVWGFGESIAMEALLASGGERGDFAATLIREWARRAPTLAGDPLAHVAPGVPLLSVYERGAGDPRLLSRAEELATVLASLPAGRHGARVHRPDLAGWEHEVWVDCMHLDAPFLVRLGGIVAGDRWIDLGAALLLGHARVLQDGRSGRFAHGFDDATGSPNGVHWGRGQGWALLGLVDTLAALPAAHPAGPELRQRLRALVRGLQETEVGAPGPAGSGAAGSGTWHTVVDHPETYVEPSVSAFVALGVQRGLRAGLLGPEAAPLAGRAREATLAALTPAGDLAGVSDATPVGPDAAHYGGRGRGVFPWGQGPAVLALLESDQAREPSPPATD